MPPLFEDLGVAPFLVESLQQLSIKAPTEIQQHCIPPALEGLNVIGSAKTGSGKTAAFALPIIQKLSEDPYGIFALVLTPTRELAFQIAEQFRVLGTGINLKQSVIVGGMDMMTQALELSRRPHVVIATPGRLVDHINSGGNSTINFKRLKFLVMDEVDRLLDDSFADDLEQILNVLPKERQTLLFTATMTPEIESLQFSSQKPFVYQCAARYDIVEKLDSKYIFIPSTVREVYLTHLLRTDFLSNTMIIFAGSCRSAERLRILLRELGIASTALHAHMAQKERIASLAKFKSGLVPILIATDVGSRGLDIPTVEVVINYELPADATDYVHRVGRTARAGRGGLSLSFVTERDVEIVHNIEAKTNKKMIVHDVSEKAALELLNEVGLAKRVASMHLMDTKFGEKKKINEQKKRTLVQHGSGGGGMSGKASSQRQDKTKRTKRS